MPKEITQAILSKKEDIEKNGLDFDDVLDVKKIPKKVIVQVMKKLVLSYC